MNLETEFNKYYGKPAIVITSYDSTFNSVSLVVIAERGSVQRRSFNVEEGFDAFQIDMKLQDMAHTLEIYERAKELEYKQQRDAATLARLRDTIEKIEINP